MVENLRIGSTCCSYYPFTVRRWRHLAQATRHARICYHRRSAIIHDHIPSRRSKNSIPWDIPRTRHPIKPYHAARIETYTRPPPPEPHLHLHLRLHARKQPPNPNPTPALPAASPHPRSLTCSRHACSVREGERGTRSIALITRLVIWTLGFRERSERSLTDRRGDQDCDAPCSNRRGHSARATRCAAGSCLQGSFPYLDIEVRVRCSILKIPGSRDQSRHLGFMCERSMLLTPLEYLESSWLGALFALTRSAKCKSSFSIRSSLWKCVPECPVHWCWWACEI
ncbi:hypothetical protein MRB53_042406 [Persea americana]|nr:hypothetical protein MRB53_042406 [Persea americana]